MLKGASQYSKPCRAMKTKAKIIVKKSPNKVLYLSLAIKEWWEKVTVEPEDNNNTVFKNGTDKGFNASIPKGGQLDPNSTEGERAEWKYAQKMEIKKNSSLIINKITPKFRDFCTAWEWSPLSVPSWDTSLNQRYIKKFTENNENNANTPPLLWNHITAVAVKHNKPQDIIKGHGETVTKWYGWAWNWALFNIFIYFLLII